jgi:hypothetical protein
MILTTPSGDNTPQPTTSTHDSDAGTTAVTTAGHPQLVSDCTPPPVLISLAHVQQMRERKRQIEALRQWQLSREVAQ